MLGDLVVATAAAVFSAVSSGAWDQETENCLLAAKIGGGTELFFLRRCLP